MRSVTCSEVKEMMKAGNDFQLIDVREPDEHEAFNIGGELIPLGEVVSHLDKIQKDKPVIFYCRKGIRSQFAIQKLQEKFPFTNLFNLVGGTEAWKKIIEDV